jgi:hypothetical protein
MFCWILCACLGRWAHARHVCTGIGPAPTTSAPGLGSPPPLSAPESGPAPTTSASGLGSPPPHLHRDWARPLLCAGGRYG